MRIVLDLDSVTPDTGGFPAPVVTPPSAPRAAEAGLFGVGPTLQGGLQR
jgi:hypothetical protein